MASNLSQSEKASARVFLELGWAGKSEQSERGIPSAFPAAQGCGGPGQGDPTGGGEGPRPSHQPPPSSWSLGLFLQAGRPPLSQASPGAGYLVSPAPRPPTSQATSRPCPSAALGPGAGPRRAGGGVEEDARLGRGGAPSLLPGVRSRCCPPFLPSPGPAGRPLPQTRTLRLAAGAPGLGPRWREGFAGRAGASEPLGRETAPCAPPPRPPPRPTVPPPAPSLLLSPPSLAKTSPHGPAAAATFPAPSCRCGGAAGRRAAAPGEPAPREPRARAPARPGPPPRPPPAVPRPPEPAAGARQPGRRGRKPLGVAPGGRGLSWGLAYRAGPRGLRVASPRASTPSPGPL